MDLIEMRIIPKATNSINIELTDHKGKVIGIFEIHDFFNYKLEISITKKVPDKDGQMQIEKLKVEKTDIGVILR